MNLSIHGFDLVYQIVRVCKRRHGEGDNDNGESSFYSRSMSHALPRTQAQGLNAHAFAHLGDLSEVVTVVNEPAQKIARTVRALFYGFERSAFDHLTHGVQ